MPLDDAAEAVGCVRLRRVAASHTEDESDLNMLGVENVSVVAGVWFETSSFQSIAKSLYVVRGYFAVHSLSTEQPCTSHRFLH